MMLYQFLLVLCVQTRKNKHFYLITVTRILRYTHQIFPDKVLLANLSDLLPLGEKQTARSHVDDWGDYNCGELSEKCLFLTECLVAAQRPVGNVLLRMRGRGSKSQPANPRRLL